ncbi:regulator of volume decrease after cellular swelling-domain-containing protein [Hyaloraphidium curvatum]|nr:regulator of volume decrease after cellular swelling-domain-containing protein [Hyaloraphidium curvatum]
MVKRPRSSSPQPAGPTSAFPLRALAALPALHVLSAEVPGPDAPRPPGAVTAHHAEHGAAVRFHPASPAPAVVPDGARGSLYVAESELIFWLPGEGRGLAVPYRAIAIHAISRGAEGGEGRDPEPPCVYVQVTSGEVVDADGKLLARGGANGHGEEKEEGAEAAEDAEEEEKDPRYDDDEDEMLEIRFIPQDASALDPIFLSLSICAELHPDQNSDGDDAPFPVFGGSDADASAGAAMARLMAAGGALGQPGGPSLGELLGPGWITADSMAAMEDEEGGEGDEGDGEDPEGRYEDAEEADEKKDE